MALVRRGNCRKF